MTRKVIPPEQLLNAYTSGFFPMAESGEAGSDIYWYTAKKRGVFPMDKFHMPRRSLRYFKSYEFEPAVNRDFEGVIDGCAERESTWISPEIRDTFVYMHELGYGHSVEVYQDDFLAGGLYGLAVGGAFFAESVFQRAPEAHKAAMYFCHQHLSDRGFVLWDVQFYTRHLGRFGCIRLPEAEYKKQLKQALELDRRFD